MTNCNQGERNLYALVPFRTEDIYKGSNLPETEDVAEYQTGQRYLKYSELQFAGAIWRWKGENNTVPAKPPSGGSLSPSWAPLPDTTLQTGYIQGRLITIPVYNDVVKPTPPNSFCWVPSTSGGTLEGRAWVSISTVPAGNPPPSSLDNAAATSDWEFVRVTNSNALTDISPITQSVYKGVFYARFKVKATHLIINNMDIAKFIIKGTDGSGVVYYKQFDVAAKTHNQMIKTAFSVDLYLDDLPDSVVDYELIFFPLAAYARVGSIMFSYRVLLGVSQESNGLTPKVLSTANNNGASLGLKKGKKLLKSNYLIRVETAKNNEIANILAALIDNTFYMLAPRIEMRQTVVLKAYNLPVVNKNFTMVNLDCQSFDYVRQLMDKSQAVVTPLQLSWMRKEAQEGLVDKLAGASLLMDGGFNAQPDGAYFNKDIIFSIPVPLKITSFFYVYSNTLGYSLARIFIKQSVLGSHQSFNIPPDKYITCKEFQVYAGELSLAQVNAICASFSTANKQRTIMLKGRVATLSLGETATYDVLADAYGFGLYLHSVSGAGATVVNNKIQVTPAAAGEQLITYTVKDAGGLFASATIALTVRSTIANTFTLELELGETRTIDLTTINGNSGSAGYIEFLAGVSNVNRNITVNSSLWVRSAEYFAPRRIVFRCKATAAIGSVTQFPYRVWQNAIGFTDGWDTLSVADYNNNNLVYAEGVISIKVKLGANSFSPFIHFEFEGLSYQALPSGTSIPNISGGVNGITRGDTSYTTTGMYVSPGDILVVENSKPPALSFEIKFSAVYSNENKWLLAHGDNVGVYATSSTISFYFYTGSTWKIISVPTSGDLLTVYGVSFGGGRVIISRDGVTVKNIAVTETIHYQTGNDWTIGSMKGERNFDRYLKRLLIYNTNLTESQLNIRTTFV